MTRTRAITLPHGAPSGAGFTRDAEVRVPTGADELRMLEDSQTRAERISILLERCTTRIGGEPPPPRTVRTLVAGDREALLLHLRATAFGDRLDCVLDCPACDEPMDLELSVDDLLLAPYAEPRSVHEAVTGSDHRVRFRLPTGADIEASVRSTGDPARAAQALLDRCLLDAVAPDMTEEIARQMGELDPQAEIALRATCPECGHRFRAMFDAAGPVLDELAAESDELLGEIHTLALHYHWSEDEILALEVPRRRRYLAMLADRPDLEASR